MKVTENTTYRMLQTNLGRISTRLENLRFEGSSGISLNKPSDDPASIRPVLTTRTQIRHNERYLETMGVTLDKMEATDGYLANIENVLVRAKELAINAVNGGLSDPDLATLADEVAELRQQILDSANATVDGKYLFAGYQENTIPFVPNPGYIPATNPPTPGQYDPADSTTWPYFYQGDNNPTRLEITPGEYLQANLTGNDLFFGVANGSWAASPPAANQSDPGRIDILGTLTRLEEAIRAGNADDPLGAGGGIQAQIDNLEVSADQERRLRSQLGNRAARVEAAMLHQEDVQTDLKTILSRYQDTDVIENFNEIIKQETALQAALSITSKVSDISILDYF